MNHLLISWNLISDFWNSHVLAEFWEISKFSFSSLQCHFWGKSHQNVNKDDFPDFFLKMVIPMLDILMKNWKDRKCEFVKTRNFILVILESEWKFWHFSEFSLLMSWKWLFFFKKPEIGQYHQLISKFLKFSLEILDEKA